MPLLIVESPNKINKIRKALDDDFVVMASVGHIMDLSKKNMGIDTDTFTPQYEIMSDKKDVVKNLKEEAKKHDEIYIATDPDREGEGIAHHLKSILPSKGKKIHRVTFTELNKSIIQQAIKKPVGFNYNLYDAQQARRMTDRLVGFKVSPVMWAKGLKSTSAGRVQSAALKFIVDREKEIRAFVEEEFWTIKAETDSNFVAEFYAINGKKFIPKDKKEAQTIVDDIKGKLKVTSYKKKTRTRTPPPPFITSTLQKDAGGRFGWSGQQVMDVAQSLFSQGLITYHRTDSTRTDPAAIKYIREKIEEDFGKKYLSSKIAVYGPKEAAQDAHEAIRPTLEAIPMGLASNERKLYDLIKGRFMASQMAPALFDQAQIKLEHKGKKVYNFKAAGSVLQFDGFLKVYGSASKDVSIPAIEEGEEVSIKELKPEQHFTKAPPRYTGASFTEKVEKEGIGRPSTYATIAEHLIKRGYVERKKNTMYATETGIMVCDYLEAFFDKLTSATFTASMESKLDEVAQGKAKMFGTLDDFYTTLLKDIEEAKRGDPSVVFLTDTDCPLCKSHKMVRKISEHGVFLGCNDYPSCGCTINFDENGKPKISEVETGLACPVCSSIAIKRKGKYGEFYGCSTYPTCDWKGHLNEDGKLVSTKKKEVKTTDQVCPNCKENRLVVRDGRYGEFLSCLGYPKCKFTANLDKDGNIISKKKKTTAKSIGEKCPQCNKSDLVERPSKYGSGTFIACSGFPKCRYVKK